MNGRDASWFCKGMTEPQYIPEHRLTAASAAQQWNTQSKAPANPISNPPIYNEIGGCKGGRPISGSFPQSRIGCRARGGREGLDGGRWTVGGRTRTSVTAAPPESQIAAPAAHSDLPFWGAAPKRAGLRLFSKLETVKSMCVLCV